MIKWGVIVKIVPSKDAKKITVADFKLLKPKENYPIIKGTERQLKQVAMDLYHWLLNKEATDTIELIFHIGEDGAKFLKARICIFSCDLTADGTVVRAC